MVAQQHNVEADAEHEGTCVDQVCNRHDNCERVTLSNLFYHEKPLLDRIQTKSNEQDYIDANRYDFIPTLKNSQVDAIRLTMSVHTYPPSPGPERQDGKSE